MQSHVFIDFSSHMTGTPGPRDNNIISKCLYCIGYIQGDYVIIVIVVTVVTIRQASSGRIPMKTFSVIHIMRTLYIHLIYSIVTIWPVVGNLFGVSGHIRKCKKFRGPEKNTNLIPLLFIYYEKKYCYIYLI